MPDASLGTKHECFSCGAKFYDLGRPEPVCPKCGANQDDHEVGEKAPASRSRRKPEPVREPVEPDEDELEGEDEVHEELDAGPPKAADVEEEEDDEEEEGEDGAADVDEPLPEIEAVDLEGEEIEGDDEEEEDDEEEDKDKDKEEEDDEEEEDDD